MAEPTLQILLVDPDPVSRLGLRIALERAANLHVVGEADTANAALALVQHRLEVGTTPTSAPTAPLSLVILEATLQIPNASPPAYLFQALKRQYPQLPILLLGNPGLDLLTLARQRGVEGFAPRGTALQTLVETVRQLAAGGRVWPAEVQRQLVLGASVKPMPTAQPSLVTRWRYRLIAPGLAEIQSNLAYLEAQLKRADVKGIERAILAGQYREVRLSRWLVQQMLPALPGQTASMASSTTASPANSPTSETAFLKTAGANSERRRVGTNSRNAKRGRLSPRSAMDMEPFQYLSHLLLEAVEVKEQLGLANLTGEVLEIDILRRDQRQELLAIVRRNFGKLLDDLRQAPVTLTQLPQRQREFIRDLWRLSITDFFGRYATLPLETSALSSRWDQEPLPRQPVRRRTVEVTPETGQVTPVMTLVDALLQEQDTVEFGILHRIPLVSELLEHLLFQVPLLVDNATYAPGTPVALRQAEAILENLLLQVANAVVGPLLNRFADQEPIKQRYYNQQLISSRDIAQFRNRLSWKYRLQQLVTEPQEIFESRRSLLTLTDRGIEKISVYAARGQELQQLRGLPLLITLALECRDAVAPPLRRAVAFLGQGLIYLLTQVVGRGLGLIGRGILQGIGSSWQEIQLNRRNSSNS